MATINFKGRSFVQNHHLAVDFHALKIDKSKSLTPSPGLNDNLIIQGDNLLALKSLLPTHSGRIKCIYIDPPYNTGNEGWVYNDAVKSPIISDWIGQVVGKDEDDLTRHDKWLCMMMPRLKLLHELQAEDGVIFVSIDDNEASSLKSLMDEIWGQSNFVAQICVQLNPRGRSMDKYLAKTHEYLLTYVKDSSRADAIRQIAKSAKQMAEYKFDDEKGKYRKLELRNRNPVFNRSNRPNLFYPFFVNPEDNSVSLLKSLTHSIEVLPLNSVGTEGCWTWGRAKAEKEIGLLVAGATAEGKWRIFRKDYAEKDGDEATTKAKAIWLEPEFNNEVGKEVLGELFGDAVFDFPKSPYLVKRCIELGTSSDDECIVLDSFAGSGTTGHAVLQLNAEDGGNRKFILIEMEEYANRTTAERVRRVIEGVPNSKRPELQDGFGGSFSYYELGGAIESSRLLEGKTLPSYEELAGYVFYTATGTQIDESLIDAKSMFIGETSKYVSYMFYEPSVDYLKSTALTLEKARKLRSDSKTDKQLLIFAPAKYVDQTELDSLRITFCQLPFEIYKVK